MRSIRASLCSAHLARSSLARTVEMLSTVVQSSFSLRARTPPRLIDAAPIVACDDLLAVLLVLLAAVRCLAAQMLEMIVVMMLLVTCLPILGALPSSQCVRPVGTVLLPSRPRVVVLSAARRLPACRAACRGVAALAPLTALRVAMVA